MKIFFFSLVIASFSKNKGLQMTNLGKLMLFDTFHSVAERTAELVQKFMNSEPINRGNPMMTAKAQSKKRPLTNPLLTLLYQEKPCMDVVEDKTTNHVFK